MPVLSKPRHEKFAQELAKGKTELEAYGIAGYSPNEGNANKLAHKPEVQARVKEITSRGAARAEVTVASLILELDEARDLARSINQPAAMVSAIREKAVLSGNRVERAETGTAGDFDKLKSLNGSELREFLAKRSRAQADSLRGDAPTDGGGTGSAGEQPACVRKGSVEQV